MHARSSDFLADLAPRRMLATGMLTLTRNSWLWDFQCPESAPPPKKKKKKKKRAAPGTKFLQGKVSTWPAIGLRYANGERGRLAVCLPCAFVFFLWKTGLSDSTGRLRQIKSLVNVDVTETRHLMLYSSEACSGTRARGEEWAGRSSDALLERLTGLDGHRMY